MAFPSSPSNGQIAVANGISYAYNSATNSWKRVIGANIAGVNVAGTSTFWGNLDVSGPGVNLTNGTGITSFNIVNSGTFVAIPTITVSAPNTAGGIQATLQPVLAIGGLPTITSGGTGYSVNDVITVVGGTGSAASYKVATVSGGVITALSSNYDGAYTALPTAPVSVTGGTGSGATLTPNAYYLRTANITNAGSGYTEQPTLSFSAGGAIAAYVGVGSNPTLKFLSGDRLVINGPAGPSLEVRNPFYGGTTASIFAQNGYVAYSVGDMGGTAALQSRGTAPSQINTGGGITQLQASHTASAVNYLQVTGATTGSTPTISAQGSDASVGLNIATKGSSQLYLASGPTGGAIRLNVFNAEQVTVNGAVNAVNKLQLKGGATGNAPLIEAYGSDTNVNLDYSTFGTGAHNFYTYDRNGGSSNLQMSVSHTSSAVNYVQVTGAATTQPTIISAQGSDSNINLNLRSKGVYYVSIQDSTAKTIADFKPVSNSVNNFQFAPAVTGAAPIVSVSGSDTNIDLSLLGKGTGNVTTSSPLVITNSNAAISTTTGAVQVVGGVGIQGNLFVGGNIQVAGNINLAAGNVNLITLTGNVGQYFGNAAGFGALFAGISSGYVYQGQTVIQASSNFNGYAQMNSQNINSGSQASSDYVATANNGNANDTYIDLGIASSTYNYPGFGLLRPNDGYLLVYGNTVTKGGNLVLGAGGGGLDNDIIFAVGGFDTTNEFGRIDGTGNVFVVKSAVSSTSPTTGAIQVAGGVGVQGNINVGGTIVTSGTYGNITGANIISANTVTATNAVFTGNISSANHLVNTVGENLLPYSNNLNGGNSPYSGAGLTFTTGQADPFGGTNAVLLNDGTTTGSHFVYDYISCATLGTYTFSCYAKAGTSNYIQLYYYNGSAGYIFNLTTGAVTQTFGVPSGGYTATNVGGGWWRFSLTVRVPTSQMGSNPALSPAQAFEVCMSENGTTGGGTSQSFTGTSQTVYVYGAQVELGSAPTAYTATTTSAIFNNPTINFSGSGASIALDINGNIAVTPVSTYSTVNLNGNVAIAGNLSVAGNITTINYETVLYTETANTMVVTGNTVLGTNASPLLGSAVSGIAMQGVLQPYTMYGSDGVINNTVLTLPAQFQVVSYTNASNIVRTILQHDSTNNISIGSQGTAYEGSINLYGGTSTGSRINFTSGPYPGYVSNFDYAGNLNVAGNTVVNGGILTMANVATSNVAVIGTTGLYGNVSLALQPQGSVDIASNINLSSGTGITAINRINQGTGYTSAPTLTISPPNLAGGVQATANAYLWVSTITLASGGTGYSVNDVLTISTGTPYSTATKITVTGVSGGVVTTFTFVSYDLYSVPPSAVTGVTGGTGSGATFNTSYIFANGFVITNAGSGYLEQPTITFSGGGGSGASAYAVVGAIPKIQTIGSALSFYTPFGESLRLIDGNNATYTQITSQGGGVQFSTQGTSSNPTWGFIGKGTGNFYFSTNNSTGTVQFNVTHTASAVNYLNVTGAVTNGRPTISAQGSDSSIGITYASKAYGTHEFQIAGRRQFMVAYSTGNTEVNFLQVAGNNTGLPPILSAQGSDANIALVLQPKAYGNIDLNSNAVILSSGIGSITALTQTATGNLYLAAPTVTISVPTTTGAVQATANANIGAVSITGITTAGTNYSVGTVLTMVGNAATISNATFVVTSVGNAVGGTGNVTSIAITTPGAYNFANVNPVTFTSASGSGLTANITYGVNAPTITVAGAGYIEQPTITFSGGGGGGASAYATVGSPTSINSIGANLSIVLPQGEAVKFVTSPSIVGVVSGNINGNVGITANALTATALTGNAIAAGGVGIVGNVYGTSRIGFTWVSNSSSAAYTVFNSAVNSIDTYFG